MYIVLSLTVACKHLRSIINMQIWQDWSARSLNIAFAQRLFKWDLFQLCRMAVSIKISIFTPVLGDHEGMINSKWLSNSQPEQESLESKCWFVQYSTDKSTFIAFCLQPVSITNIDQDSTNLTFLNKRLNLSKAWKCQPFKIKEILINFLGAPNLLEGKALFCIKIGWHARPSTLYRSSSTRNFYWGKECSWSGKRIRS